MSSAQTERAAYATVIVGFGPVGAACAIALRQRLGDQQTILVLDSRPADEPRQDSRMIAVSYGTRILLERLHAWDARVAHPITRIHVSERGAFGRTLLAAADYGLEALGYVLPYTALAGRLGSACKSLPIEVRQGVHITASAAGPAGGRALELSDGTHIAAAYVVHAEGGLYHQQKKRTLSHDYQQEALTAWVSASRPIAGLAFERFTQHGPLALLPARSAAGDGYALVWCARPRDTARRMQLSDTLLLAELQTTFGQRIGRFLSISERASFPLGLNVGSGPTVLGELAIGNAAQTLHPVAGQGFNLGLRDALGASQAIADHFASPEAVARGFRRARQRDRIATVGTTDFLPRVFSTELWPVAQVRGTALALLDLIGPLRRPLARQMMNGQR